MLKCEDVQNELQAFLSNEVDEPQRLKIDDHIKNCRDCSRALRQLERLSEVLHLWEAPAPSPLMWDRLKSRIRARESLCVAVFTNRFVRKVAFHLTEVAAVVVLTLSVSNWLAEPAPEVQHKAVQDRSATINFYLREHQDVAARAVPASLSAPPPASMHVDRRDILYYEFMDDPYEFGRPGIILRGPSPRRPVIAAEAPAISNGHTLTLAEARKAATFDLVSPPRLHPGYMLDQVRRIDGRDALHLLYTDGVSTLSLFEQPLDGGRGLEAQDFREYAIYRSEGQAGRAILAWSDDSLSYVLIGNLEMSQLMDMAQSIRAAE
jgi:anti-sigma factor RsiW